MIRLFYIILFIHLLQVSGAQKKDFYVGTAIPGHVLAGSDSSFVKDVIRKHFSIVTLSNDLKWNKWEKNTPYYSQDYIDHSLTWLRSNGIEAKGHHLIWGPLKKEDNFNRNKPQQYYTDFLKHAVEKVNYTKDEIMVWDFINHPIQLKNYSVYFDDLYSTEMILAIQDTLLSIHPEIDIRINEGGILSHANKMKRKKYFDRIEKYLSAGIKLDGIGFMGHFHDEKGVIDTLFIKETLDQFSEFNLPITITEFDYRFGEKGERLELTEKQQKRQAENTKILLNLFYQHPSVEGIILWGFWENAHWYPSAAFWDSQKRIKPNGKVLEKFIEKVKK